MKKDNKLAQKGGMMIEALAMLGLIAVVTPTMYKKSAERTLEVEDINTATTMRSVMSAADSYVSSHYGELIQEISSDETNNKTKPLSISDLQPYLPYGFNADKLYDFGEPQVSVVRNGNNLTAFVLFPAKEDAENGLGQERTVRIATLVGANGGYVNGDQTAKGIGGIWNLKKTDFQTVFGSTDDAKPAVYSIVTASSDAINNTNTEEDTDKFLYRTDANGKWHNTMRADLYMGGFDDTTTRQQDGYYQEGKFSIRNVNRMIIGSEFNGENTTAEEEDSNNNYGLYVTGTNSDAFIKGSLEAVDSQFKVDENSLKYEGNGDKFIIDSEGLRFGQVAEDAFSPKFTVTNAGDITNEGSIKLGGVVAVEGDNSKYLIEGSGKKLSLVDDRIKIDNDQDEDEDIVVINADGTKGDSNPWDKSISYNESNTIPTFPVKVDSNMRVDGILATAQLDTQNIRAAELEVGSENINDANKWLKVDATGIHGKNKDDVTNMFGGTQTETIFDVKKGEIKLSTDKTTKSMGLSNTFQTSFLMNTGINLAVNYPSDLEDRNSNIKLDRSGIKLSTNNTIQQQIAGTDVTFSSLQNGTTQPYNTNVKIQKTNFEVSDEGGDVVFSVKGNKSQDAKLDTYTRGTDPVANVAVHGDALFTSSDNSKHYLKIGNEFKQDAVVNIVQGSKTLSQILTVDGDADEKTSGSYTSQDENNRDVTNNLYNNGTVYIRKGMVEVKPGEPSGLADEDKTAANGYGIIKASRFVANNLDKNGNDVKVPQFFDNTEFNKYNYGSGTDDEPDNTEPTGRYDTYMVNPAYTSVMHDIKLTTRGGARLSDILPDFINKGIYITSNTYPDLPTEMSITINGGDISVGGKKVGEEYDGIKFESSNAPITLGAKDSWASPYLGFVPAPQCPPGYNRIITMAPQSFMMAQAGQMQKGTNPRGAAYYVKNQVPDDTAFTEYTDANMRNGAYVQQAFVKPTIAENADVTINGTRHSRAANTQGTELSGVSDENPSQTATYFLASFGDQTVPLTIQQSTWLKTNVIPVGKNSASYAIGSNIASDDYVLGWAALMGFVYDAATYQTVIDRLSGNIPFNEGNTSVYWNVFPVRRKTLEAYATTYCYFDRNNIGGNWSTSSDFTSGAYIDHYNALTDYGNYTKEKKINDAYKKRLNDPTLKYDEVW